MLRLVGNKTVFCCVVIKKDEQTFILSCFKTVAMTLRRHNSGQLGFNVHNEGMVVDVEPLGLAQGAGLKQHSRLVEVRLVDLR